MFWDSGRKVFAGILVSVSRIFVKKEKYLSRGFSWGKIIFLRNSFFKNAFRLLVRRLKFQLILPPGLSKLQSTYLEKFSGKRFSLKQNFHYYKYFGNLWTFGRFGEKKIFFFDRNIIRTNILGSELKCFGHFAYFLSAVCQNSISHNEEKLFTEKVFVVKLVQQLFSDFGDENLACLWTLQILVSSETFGQNFCLGNLFFFEMNVRLLAELYRSSGLGQSCSSYIPLRQWNFTRGIFFEKRSFSHLFWTSGGVPAVIPRKLFAKVVKAAL